MFRFLITLTVALFSTFNTNAQKAFAFNSNCATAYNHVMSLKLNEAEKIIEQELLQNPNNLAAHFINNYIDFFILFLTEDNNEFNNRKANKDKRLKLINEADDSSPVKGFSKAVIELQWAVVNMKFGNKWAAGWGFRDAFKLANENAKKYPAFYPNYMLLGPMQMMASTVPSGYKWLSNMMGIKGNLTVGKNNMNAFLNARDNWSQFFMNEGIFYYCYIMHYVLNKGSDALALIKSKNLDIVNNHLFAYMTANLSLNNKQSKQAIQIIQNKNPGNQYYDTPIWDYLLGFAKLYNLQPDANIYFEKYLAEFKGKFYVKDTWLKLAYHYQVHNNPARYDYAISQVIAKGSTTADADDKAYKEAKAGIKANTILLKARLLNDGGNNIEAINLLAQHPDAYTDPDDHLEMLYRSGRIYEDMGRNTDALRFYQHTINLGSNKTQYFAARAALQSGIIYENQKNYTKATEYFNICLKMENHDYKSSLDQKAKMGLQRIGK
ncbi:tetratricopeptide repeat protein [Polluticaenibacter yanchengensis]|uniref:Tetratricopeptide repeat protein n=1 Tax=Polluticaenibacter yanchengensis TaxID=3014562 RepID=A0ABT4UL84_9BACT|nr:hypothetical protein [Chitinophagaceae bacterium LY-5]